MKLPPGIVYGVDARPPTGVTLLSGLQQVGVIGILLVYPLVLAREAGLAAQGTRDLVSMSMLVLGLGAALQSQRRGPVGAGYLCPPVCTAAYLSPCLLAIKTGGLGLAFGMTLFGGLVEVAMARLLRPLRPYLPPELSGLVVVLIAISVGNLGIRSLLGVGAPEPPGRLDALVALITLSTMVGLSVWGRGMSRLLCAMIGMVVGYLLAAALGLLPAEGLAALAEAPLFSVPSMPASNWQWDAALAVPFLIAAVGTVIRCVGDISIAQQINDADWVRPHMRSVGAGVLANGLLNVLSGAVGAHPVSTFTSSVGMSAATGVTSARVGLAIGAIFVVLAFLPKVIGVLLIMPPPVVGSAMLFTAAIIFVSGVRILAMRLIDQRRSFVIGLSFIVGLAADIHPTAFQVLPTALQPAFSNSLVLGTVLALVLNLLARIGVRRTTTLQVDPNSIDPAAIDAFINAKGAAWGARRDVIERIRFNLGQSLDTLVHALGIRSPITIHASFDEFRLNLRVSYTGPVLELPTVRPTADELIDSEDGERRLAGFLLRRIADQVHATERNGRASLLFRFDH
ncbi:MAG: purine/pyrimidine permease [Rhodocyclaceae bacterium]|nr:purine/pyrimidine permease [Rhodocyclaceae bacterium]